MYKNLIFQRFVGLLGVELDEVSWKEKTVSIFGGIVSITSILAISQYFLPQVSSPLIIASLGASSVLLFAVPHGQLSQPWPVFGGHFLAALIGVTCARYIPNVALSSGCAVGFSIAAMHQFKCIHPPGGATALTAVIGGPTVLSLGYSYVWFPVALNAFTIIVIAVVFNFGFTWRRYPSILCPRPAKNSVPPVTHAEVVAVLKELDSFVDITEGDLIRIYTLLNRKNVFPPAQGKLKRDAQETSLKGQIAHILD